MTTIKFNKNFACTYGVVEQVAPQVRRIVAENPSPYTFYGTGTYIIGRGRVAVIDPGPNDHKHIDAVAAAVSGETITHILVTHTHLDHSPGCGILKTYADAPTYGYGPHGAGRIMSRDSVEEGADKAFVPDVKINNGDVISGDGWSVECVHTPGHTSNHVCYQLREQKALFSGDHVMAWSTSIISPPDGNLSDYLDSLALLLEGDDRVYRPTHGPAIANPRPFVQSYIEHRRQRIEQVIACLRQWHPPHKRHAAGHVPGPARQMYPAAARSVLSTLIYLIARDRVGTDTIDLRTVGIGCWTSPALNRRCKREEQ